jgi:hypothetical protein
LICLDTIQGCRKGYFLKFITEEAFLKKTPLWERLTSNVSTILRVYTLFDTASERGEQREKRQSQEKKLLVGITFERLHCRLLAR